MDVFGTITTLGMLIEDPQFLEHKVAHIGFNQDFVDLKDFPPAVNNVSGAARHKSLNPLVNFAKAINWKVSLPEISECHLDVVRKGSQIFAFRIICLLG